jgi:hypothetical protein
MLDFATLSPTYAGSVQPTRANVAIKLAIKPISVTLSINMRCLGLNKELRDSLRNQIIIGVNWDCQIAIILIALQRAGIW